MEEHSEKALTGAGSPKRLELVLGQPFLAVSEEIGRWSAVLTECRSRTLKAIATIAREELDWQPPLSSNTIGTLLYHIALIEADWLYTEILEQQMPEDLRSLLSIGDRESGGALTNVHEPVNQHAHRLALVREQLLGSLGKMTLAEFRRIRHLRDYDVTPEWVVIHLLQHEAEHRGQILVLRKAFTDLQGRLHNGKGIA
ncbi:MAG: DinB family protein [Blastocatellia bacterium]